MVLVYIIFPIIHSTVIETKITSYDIQPTLLHNMHVFQMKTEGQYSVYLGVPVS